MAYEPGRSAPTRETSNNTYVRERGSSTGMLLAVVGVLAIIALVLFAMWDRDDVTPAAGTEPAAATGGDTAVDVDVAPAADATAPAADAPAADTTAPADAAPADAAPADAAPADAAPADAGGEAAPAAPATSP